MVAALGLAQSSGLPAPRSSADALPRSPTDPGFGTVGTHVLVNEIFVTLFNAHAFPVKPIIARAITSNHERPCVRLTTSAIQIVIPFTFFVHLFLVLVIVLPIVSRV
jgi:hypothetical protein